MDNEVVRARDRDGARIVGGMGAFAEMFPGRKPEQKARDEDSDGRLHVPRIPDGPLDLDSGVLRLEPGRPDSRAGKGPPAAGRPEDGKGDENA